MAKYKIVTGKTLQELEDNLNKWQHRYPFVNSPIQEDKEGLYFILILLSAPLAEVPTKD